MEIVDIRPKTLPIALLNKNWSRRPCLYIKGSEKFLEKIHDMKVREDDVWIVTWPKCGTTWMQEMVWLLLNDLDFEKSKSIDLSKRSPFLEFKFLMHQTDLDNSLKTVEDLPSPRLIKTHHPLPQLPAEVWTKKAKIIYVFRNPKDIAISSYYHLRNMGLHSKLTKEEILENFLTTDRFGGPFWPHVLEFYELRNEPFIYYTSFEKMKENLSAVVRDICNILDKSISDSQMEQLLAHLSFDNMKENKMCNHVEEIEIARQVFKQPYEDHRFIRKGQVNGYKSEMSPEMINKYDHWIKDNLRPYNVTLEELLLLQ